MDDDARTLLREREGIDRAVSRGQRGHRSAIEDRLHADAASARRILRGHELLSHDELDRLERQIAIGQTARERDDLHRLRVVRLTIATAYGAVLLLCAATTIIGGMAAGLTPAELWGYVKAGW